jgi:hypothetical protein
VDIQSAEFILLITQLRDVRPAGESTKMAMENHQKPTAFEVVERMNCA